MIDTLIALAVLSIGVMGFAATTLSSSRLSKAETERGLALVTLQRFIERLRADDDWATLYTRLKAKTSETAGDTGLTRLSMNTSLVTYAPTAYYADFVSPTSLGTVTVLVQVPYTTVAGVAGLYENTAAPRYGLPYDLTGDGIVDAANHAVNCRALPIVARLRWVRPGQRADEVVLATWLRKDG